MKTVGTIILGITCLSIISFTSFQQSKFHKPAQVVAEKTSMQQDYREVNKKMVVEFYQQFFGDKDLTAADRYLGDTYIQHNPGAANGREALKDLIGPLFKNAPKTKVDIRRVAADGDLVWLHIKGNYGGKEVAIVDIFRIENGKIVEHWDVIQQVPQHAANDNTMF